MEPADITVEILKGIRDEVREFRKDVNERFKEVDGRFKDMRDRFRDNEEPLERLHRRQIDDGTRLATEAIALRSVLETIRDELRDQRPNRSRLDDLEHRVEALENRTG